MAEQYAQQTVMIKFGRHGSEVDVAVTEDGLPFMELGGRQFIRTVDNLLVAFDEVTLMSCPPAAMPLTPLAVPVLPAVDYAEAPGD